MLQLAVRTRPLPRVRRAYRVYPRYEVRRCDFCRRVCEDAVGCCKGGGRVVAWWCVSLCLSRTLSVLNCAGTIPERADDGKIYNTATVYSPEGALV